RWTTATGAWASRSGCWRSGASACARTSCLDPVRHEDRVDVLVAAAVVLLAVALLHEAELLVQGDRGRVPREDVQLELADARLPPSLDRGLEQRGAAAASAV